MAEYPSVKCPECDYKHVDEKIILGHLKERHGYVISAPPDVLLAIVGDIQDAVLGIAETNVEVGA